MKRILHVSVSNKFLKYGDRYGITLKQAQGVYIRGYMQNINRQKHSKYRGIKEVEFKFRR